MTGIAIIFDDAQLGAAAERLVGLTGRQSRLDMLDAIGAIAESGARRRLQEEKAGPDGEPWAEWAEATRERREPHHSLLQYRGDLLDSIAFEVSPDGTSVKVGSPLPYAAIQQLGSADEDDGAGPVIPARPYLGLSAEDRADIEDAIQRQIDRLIGGGV
ncbi:MAG: phage virion morphogenesis protein [Pseudomonadota bacterium]